MAAGSVLCVLWLLGLALSGTDPVRHPGLVRRRRGPGAPAGDSLRRRWIAAVAIVLLLLPLGIFKYFNFFAESFAAVVAVFGFEAGWTTRNVILPVGISFYTFQAISYVVDVSRGQVAEEKRLLRYALFIAFFPQLVAGPIMRARVFLPQLREVPVFPDARDFMAGLLRFFWGLTKKVLIADRLALALVDPVFAHPETHSAGTIGLAVFAFGLMIYADFSGYSDMAIAIARMMGYRLQENFLAPYTAPSVREFWRRWHVSLSSWVRDYLYIPLGGSRSGTALRRHANLLVAMALVGLWHGAAWTFLWWGVLHGTALVVERLAGHATRTAGGWGGFCAGWTWTTAIVAASWLIFRADGAENLSAILQAVAADPTGPLPPKALMAFVGLAAAAIYGEQILVRRWRTEEFSRRSMFDAVPFGWSHAAIGAILLVFLLSANPDIGQRSFVYFQF